MSFGDADMDRLNATAFKTNGHSAEKELELIQEKHLDNTKYLLTGLKRCFKDQEEARHVKSYVKRQTLQLLHRTIELTRSGKV